MSIHFEHSSVVLIANNVNVSIFRPLWMARNAILREDELAGELLISPVTVHVPTPNFELDVLPDRVQWKCSQPYAEAQADVQRILGGIARMLPHTPYKAVGLNFAYLLTSPPGVSFDEFDARLFASPCTHAVEALPGGNARYGAYFSIDVLDMRLKVDLKPTRLAVNLGQPEALVPMGTELMRGLFNFHRDLKEDPIPDLERSLQNWERARGVAQDTLRQMLAAVHAGA